MHDSTHGVACPHNNNNNNKKAAPQGDRCTRHWLHYWAVLMLSIKILQEWEEARKQAAAAENMQLQHDADARLLAAQQEHVTFMKDAELWNQLEASMAEEFHMQDASLHYEARLRESKQLHRSQLADSEECRIHTLAAQQREHDSLLQV